MRIDIHTHIMPDRMPNWVQKFGYGDFIHLEHRNCEACMMKGDKMFRVVEKNCFDAGTRIAEMNDTGISVQVLSTIPVLFNYWAKPEHGLETARFFNDHIAETVAKYPHRFIGIGTLPLQDIDKSIQEAERCVKELKFPGFEIGTNINGINLNAPSLFPLFEALEKLDASLFVHPWEMMGQDQIQRYWLPWLVSMPAETSRAICSMIFGGVFKKFPKLRVAFAHGGGSFPATIGRIEHGFNVRPDLVAIDNNVNPRNYLGHFWIDSLVHDPLAMKFILDVVGEDKICLGSDYPFPLGELKSGAMVTKMDIGQQVKEKIFFQNALRWLGLSSGRFEQQ
ncbi:MAG: amidohydrolase [Chitinophagaceae bacterium]|nr:amidohydrolase [Bacteroidota bacterium]MCC6258709.1 amidohydrolase [Chitinophagaceae bacterium]MCW5916070.1 amidohydrolase [Ferruginibacter sp.]